MQTQLELPLGRRKRVSDPDEHEIKARCEEIQATWSERERQNRSSMTRFIWQVPRNVPAKIQSLLELGR